MTPQQHETAKSPPADHPATGLASAADGAVQGPSGAMVEGSQAHPPAAPSAKSSPRRRTYIIGGALLACAIALYYLVPGVVRALHTVSTDDAYVNGHVTFVAARVAGQVMKVFVDDNNRVHKGDRLVQLDKEPYQIQVDLKKAQVESAKADYAATEDRMRGIMAQARSNRFRLEHVMEDVRNQLALLKSNVAQLQAEQASLVLAEQDYARGEKLVGGGAISKQQFDQYKATLDVAQNRVKSAEQTIQQTRASLGLPMNIENPLDAPENLDQTFSTVRQALSDLLQSVAPLGVTPSTYNLSPQEVIDEFYKRDPEKNLDRIFAQLLKDNAPIKQAAAKLHEAEANLANAELDLRYCDVVSEIDGVVTRRNVNPGNNVQAGQSLMVIRSLTEIWVDANFKETQIAELRIGQPVELEIDMYGSRKYFQGRISGFSGGTGSTLAILPPQNATGNFVKVVQRLPVRIDLEDYDPESETLFAGLSVVPHVYFKKSAEGPNAGKRLQEVAPVSATP